MGNKFSWQSFISIVLLFSFVVMLLSGVVLYVAPEGSLSRWIAWDVLNLTKKQWEHQHTIFSFLFVLFSLLHIFKINWALLLSYFTPESLRLSHLKEILVALLITLLVFVGTLYNFQPIKYILKIGSGISDNFGENVEIPGVSDSEKLTIEQFSVDVLDSSYKDVVKILREKDFKEISKGVLVEDFCEMNNISPSEFYKILKGELLSFNIGLMDFPDITSKTNSLDQINSLL